IASWRAEVIISRRGAFHTPQDCCMEAAIMSRTLNLSQRLLERGRFLQEIGRTHDAVRVLGRLAGLRDLPAAAAEETQTRLAEMHLRQYQFAQARRHLTAALTHNPTTARYHY